MKIPVLSVWPGSDGADYHFQIDYLQSIRVVHRSADRRQQAVPRARHPLAIEPKPYEPRELYMIVPTAASAILVAQKVNQACGGNNCGLTIDYGHQKMEATTASTACDLAAFAGVPVHKFDVNDARQGRNDQDLMFGTLSIPESVEYLYTTFVRDYRGWYSQDQFTYREDPTRAIERSMINFANLALKAVRILRPAGAARQGARRRHRPRRARRRLSGVGRLRRACAAFTIGVDFGTNSVRAVVVSTAPTAAPSARGVFDYPSGDQGVLLHPRDPHLARQNPGRLHRRPARIGHRRARRGGARRRRSRAIE